LDYEKRGEKGLEDLLGGQTEKRPEQEPLLIMGECSRLLWKTKEKERKLQGVLTFTWGARRSQRRGTDSSALCKGTGREIPLEGRRRRVNVSL